MESIKELRNKVAKSKASHFAPRHDVVVRKISIYLTWLILHTPLSANGVTILQIIIGAAGAVLLISANYAWNIVGIFLLQLGYILDCCDGEVARYKSQSSVNGVFLDLIGHEVVIPFMYMGLALGEYQRSGRFEVLLLGFTTALFSLRFDISAMFQVVNTLFAKADNPSYNFESLQKRKPSRSIEIATSKPSLFRVIFRYPESMNLITVILLVDWLLPFTLPFDLTFTYLFLAIFGMLIPLARVYSIYKIFRAGEIEARYLEIVQAIKKKINQPSENNDFTTTFPKVKI